MISIRNTSLRRLARVTARSGVLALTLSLIAGCADDAQQRVMVNQPVPNSNVAIAQTTQTTQTAQAAPVANPEVAPEVPLPSYGPGGVYHTRPTYYFPIVGMGVGH